MLISLVSLQQGNGERSEKLIKIVILTNKIFISSEWYEEFKWSFQERCKLW